MAAAFSPLDEELALPAGQLSSGLASAVVRLGTWLPFARAGQEVARLTGVRVSESTVRRLTEAAGRAYEAEQTAQVARLERELSPAPQGPVVQALSVDGAMVPLVGGAWAEVKTLALGTVRARPASRRTRPQQEVETTELSYFSRLADHETFTRLALVETHRRGTETAGTVCALSDGAAWIQGFIDHHRPDAVRILDWPHATGYLATVARALYGADTPAASAWLTQQKTTLLHGEPLAVLSALVDLRSALAPVASGQQQRLAWLLPGADPADPPWQGVLGRDAAQQALAVVTDALEYLRKREAHLRYACFRAAGYPLGSGSVESANKLLVEARLKGAGMRWALASVNPMVALRTIAYSDRWAEAWPRIITAQHRARQGRTTQRRIAQQDARARRAAEQRCVREAAPTPAASPPIAPTRQRSAPAPARGKVRTPAPDHPWRRAALSPRRSA